MFNLEPKTKKLVKLAGKIFLGIVVASTVAWFLVINPYLIAQEKKRFEAASVELDKLAQEIQAKIGAAQEVKAENFCDRPNQKFTKGSLSCNVGVELKYSVDTLTRANDLLYLSSSLNPDPIRKGPLAKDVTFVSGDIQSTQILYQDMASIESMSCSFSYRYEAKKSIEGKLFIRIGCGDSARSEYFPLQD